MRHRAPDPAAPVRRLPVLAVGGLALALVASFAVSAWPAAQALTGADAPSLTSPLPTITVAAPAVTTSPSATRPAAATPSATPSSTGKAKHLNLAQLRAEVDRIDDDLATRAGQLDAARAALAESQKRLTALRAEATEARTAADEAHVALGRYAAAAYRGQSISPVVSVLLAATPDGSSDGATDTLRTVQDLEQTADVKTDIATYAATAAQNATTLETQAVTLAAENEANASRLKTERAALAAEAKATQKQLEAEQERIALKRIEALNKDCLAKAKVAAEFPNGMIPAKALCSIGIGSYLLRGDAAVAFKKLAVAYEKHFDTQICVTSAYRTRALQARLFADDPVMVAAPGKSHHGLGLATDLCGGIQTFGSKQHEWMKKHAGRFGFYHPDWAEPDGVTPEPWHWEYDAAE